jgi:predicted RNA methylase
MTQLALQLEPSRVDTAAALDEMVAESDRAVARLLLPCFTHLEHSSIPGALAAERCREQPRDFCDRLMDELDLANRRAEEGLQHIRGMLAELERVPVEQLDQHLAAREAEEKRMREEARAEKPARASASGKAAKGDGATIGIGRAALSERQRELLSFVRVEDNVAIFSSEERVPDWDLLKRIMVALGGTWKTGGKKAPGGFRFPDDLDAAELVRLAKETGEITDPKAAEFFATPRPLAELLVDRADLDFCSRVLEPSAGLGGIALAVRERQPSAHVVCIEALEASAEKLRQLGFDTTCADFLSVTPASLNTFTHVLMNPPFSKRQDIQHVRHAYTFLEPGGVLVAIMSAGVKFRDDKLAREFRAFVGENGGDIWENPEGSFLESGTAVRTVMVRVPRPA